MDSNSLNDFPYALTITLPLPTHRLAKIALQALQVDAELSPLVRRVFFLDKAESATGKVTINGSGGSTYLSGVSAVGNMEDVERLTVLKTEYRATTNRMLRVAVNGFMESLGVVLGVMEELDIDVLRRDLSNSDAPSLPS